MNSPDLWPNSNSEFECFEIKVRNSLAASEIYTVENGYVTKEVYLNSQYNHKRVGKKYPEDRDSSGEILKCVYDRSHEATGVDL